MYVYHICNVDVSHRFIYLFLNPLSEKYAIHQQNNSENS